MLLCFALACSLDVDGEDLLAFGAGSGPAVVDSDGEEGGARAPGRRRVRSRRSRHALVRHTTALLALTWRVIPLSRRAPEGGLRLRARIELDGEEYRGQRTSRAQAGLDSRPPRRPQPADDDEDDDDEDDEGEDDEEEDSLDMDGEFDDSDEEADVDDEEDEEAPRGKKSRGVAMRVDGEAAALEAELAAVAAAEAAAATSLRARAGAERATARAVAPRPPLLRWRADRDRTRSPDGRPGRARR